MDDRKVEKYFSHFTIKGPRPDLKNRVLLRAKSAVIEEEYRSPVSFNFRLLSSYAFVFAVLLFLGIISLESSIFMTKNILVEKTLIANIFEAHREIQESYYE